MNNDTVRDNDAIVSDFLEARYGHTDLSLDVSPYDRDGWRALRGLKPLPLDQAKWCLVNRRYDAIEVEYEFILDRISYEEAMRLHLKFDLPFKN